MNYMFLSAIFKICFDLLKFMLIYFLLLEKYIKGKMRKLWVMRIYY